MSSELCRVLASQNPYFKVRANERNASFLDEPSAKAVLTISLRVQPN